MLRYGTMEGIAIVHLSMSCLIPACSRQARTRPLAW
jgi:hypothetical protein